MPAAAAYIDDRPDDGVFRVRRSIYLDPALFDRELDRIFARAWIYLCHESQLRAHGDYVATAIGRQPVFVVRGEDGELRCFFDACAHRGSLLTTRRRGNARTLTCRYHGWSYDSMGRCVRVTGRDDGYTDEALARLGADLTPIPRLGVYGGFVFGCLDPGAGELTAFLGGARPFIDLIAAQSAQGMEVLRGESRYVMDGNWKLQTENSTDGYHVASLHRNFAHAVAFRDSLLADDADPLRRTESSRILALDSIAAGSYDLGGGHMLNWSDRGAPEAGPLHEAESALRRRLPAAAVDWMVGRARTVTLFPNLLLNDVASTAVRVWRPLSADRTEIETWCLAPVGESARARRARIRKYEDFFLPASLAAPDDVRAMEGAHRGSAAGQGWNDFCRGRHTLIHGPDRAARALGAAVASSNPGREGETAFHGFYRAWRSWMERP